MPSALIESARRVIALQRGGAAGDASSSSAALAPLACFDTVFAMAPIVAGHSPALLHEAAAEVRAVAGGIDIVAACAVAAVLAAAPPAEQWPKEHHAAAAELGAAFWETLAGTSAAVSAAEVECAAVCAVKLYPDRGGAPVVDAAVETLRGDPDQGPSATTTIASATAAAAAGEQKGHMTLENALEVCSVLVHAVTHSESAAAWAAPVSAHLIEAALRCVEARNNRGDSFVPVITRRILIPLLQVLPASVRDETRRRAIALASGLHASGKLSEGIVLIAALFDFFFPPSGSPEPASDLRRSDLLWGLLRQALESTGPRVEARGGTALVSQLHLQAVYLLKRIVAYTWQGEKNADAAVFHPLFRWRGKASDTAWTSFFLVFDALGEYGMHLVSPALERVPALASAAAGGTIAVAWVEVLLDKAVSHANTGVRKLGLGCLWTGVAIQVVLSMSKDFVLSSVFRAACDARLCAEPDKVVLPGSFLDCKAFQGKPCHNLPQIQPVVERFVTFYVRYFGALDHAAGESASALAALLRDTAGRHNSRFGVAVTARLLQQLGREAFAGSLLTDGCIAALHGFVAEAVHDNQVFWLEARLNALVADFVLEAATPAAVATPGYRALFTLLGLGGSTGGAALSAVDATGTAGTVGSSLPQRLLRTRLDAAARSNEALKAFVTAGQLTPEAVQRFIAAGVPDAAEAKRMVATIDPAASAEAIAVVFGEAAALGERTSMPPERRVAAALLYSQVATATFDARPADPVPAPRVLDSLLRATSSVVVEAEARLASATSCEAIGEEWYICKAAHFDCLAAAVFEAARRVSSTELAGSSAPAMVLSALELAARLAPSGQPSPAQEYARFMVLRDALRFVHTLLAACLVEEAERAHGPDAWRGVCTLATVNLLLGTPSPRLHAIDLPGPLSSDGWGFVGSQYGRYAAQVLFFVLEHGGSSGAGGDGAWPTEVVARVGDRALAMLDECSQSNLNAAFDLLAWACRNSAKQEGSDAAARVDHWLRAMQHRLGDDVLRREAHRCAATFAFALCDSATSATSAASEGLMAIVADEATSDRMAAYIGLAVAAHAVARPETMRADNRDYRRVLMHLAVLRNSTQLEEELDACLAATEPCVCRPEWDELRRLRPPGTLSHCVSRAAALSALMHHAATHDGFAASLVKELLEWNATHPVVNHSPCMPDSPTHRVRVRLWQLLCGLAALIAPAEWPAILDDVADNAMEVINMGSVRRYIELFMMIGLRVSPDSYSVVRRRLSDVDLRAQVCSSNTLVALHVLKRHGRDSKALRDDLLPILVRLSASNFHIMRLIAQIGLHDLSIDPNFDGLLPPEVLAIAHLVEHNADAKKFRERYLDTVVFDDVAASTPAAIFSTQRKEGEVWLHDSLPPIAFDRVSHAYEELVSMLGVNTPFERFRVERLLGSAGFDVRAALGQLRSLPYIPHVSGLGDAYLEIAREVVAQLEEAQELVELQRKKEAAAAGGDADANMQRKVTSWWNSEVHNELHPRAIGTRTRQQLVVVASLIDYPVNIAGLCRCAEIFAIEKIVVPDYKVFQKKEFVAVARSAELWLPWEEVAPSALAVYLSTMRQLGYTVVGVEQTADSVPLQQYSFPPKTVVVLGAEGTGIPPHILPCLDVCVEIPQFGLIRSLNVHVTGAVAMYEFTRQHLMEK